MKPQFANTAVPILGSQFIQNGKIVLGSRCFTSQPKLMSLISSFALNFHDKGGRQDRKKRRKHGPRNEEALFHPHNISSRQRGARHWTHINVEITNEQMQVFCQQLVNSYSYDANFTRSFPSRHSTLENCNQVRIDKKERKGRHANCSAFQALIGLAASQRAAVGFIAVN